MVSLDGTDAVVEAGKFFQLFLNHGLGRVADVPVPNGNVHLHRIDSLVR